MPVFFYLKYEDVDANTTDHCHGAAAQRLRQHYQPYGARAGAWQSILPGRTVGCSRFGMALSHHSRPAVLAGI
ncbi:hypothetical protein KPHVMX_80174 [Klebsiella pneumoniae]|nr:hypothetical protein KPHVMX_80174 [Klebsiella pneumoniae]